MWVLFVLWLIVSFILWYFYLFFTGFQEDEKWWTFVEWIFDQVSYLPYLKNDDQSVFYQKFLFRSCLNLYELDENWDYARDLCKVYTEDDQNYVLKLIDENAVWSDWVPVSIEDVFFTYDEIIRQNRWNLSSLNARSNISVSLEEWKVKVSFPTVSADNLNFFVNSILPRHAVEFMDLDTYRDSFSLNPITNSCAKIMFQNRDINSLIFDVNECSNTNFYYYQVKNFENFDNLERSLMGSNKKWIVDVYSSMYWLEWFTGQNILTSKLLWLFFNTDSWKANIRLRRSLWGLIYHNFFTWDYQKFVSKYDWEFLNYYVSAWENVTELLNRLTLLDGDEQVDTNDLKDSWVQELPASMSINWVDRKFVFFMQKPEKSRELEIKFSNEFSDIKIKASSDWSVWSPKNYKTKDKKIVYNLVNWENLKVWVNNFTVSWFIKNKTYTIASIDIYVFDNLSNSQNEENKWRLSVLYYNDPASVFAVQQMRNIFKNAWILENFIFEPVYNSEELEWKLLMWSYDIFLWTVDLWSRWNILPLFSTEDPLINPSRYRNPILNSLINQYYKTRDENVKSQINILLAQDMPAIFIWNTYEPIQVQEKIKQSVFLNEDENELNDVHSYKWRYDIYSKYSIVHSVRVNKSNAFSWEVFRNFMLSNLFISENKNSDNVVDNVETWKKFPYIVFDNAFLLKK